MTWIKRLGLMIIFVGAMAGCAAQTRTYVKPNECVKYNKVVIKDVDYSKLVTFYINQQSIGTVKESLSKLLRNELQLQLKQRGDYSKVTFDGEVDENTLVVYPYITRLNGGDPIIRIISVLVVAWPIAGRTNIEIDAELKDSNGNTIGTFKDYKSKGWSIAEYDEIFLEYTQDLAEKLADYIIELKHS